MSPYRTSAGDGGGEALPEPGGGDLGIVWMTLIVGLIPFIGLLVWGRWSSGELGIAMVLVLFAGHGLVRAYMDAQRSSGREHRKEEDHEEG